MIRNIKSENRALLFFNYSIDSSSLLGTVPSVVNTSTLNTYRLCKIGIICLDMNKLLGETGGF